MIVRFARNRSCFLVGLSWSHDPEWAEPRLTHVYLGPFIASVSRRRATSP